MKEFSVEIDCAGGGRPHKHLLTVAHQTGAYGVSLPGTVRLEYVCPVIGTPLLATFQPPAGAARPFTVRSVT